MTVPNFTSVSLNCYFEQEYFVNNSFLEVEAIVKALLTYSILVKTGFKLSPMNAIAASHGGNAEGIKLFTCTTFMNHHSTKNSEATISKINQRVKYFRCFVYVKVNLRNIT